MIMMAAIACFATYAQDGAGTKGKSLVAYFSATGNTEKVAQTIASVTGADLLKIQPEKTYSSADLDWHDKSSRSSVEMNDPKARPALSPNAKNPAEYETIYLGFPIWWDQAPRVINTFLESADFSGKTVIPFATSGSSSINNAAQELQKTYPNIKWGKAKLMKGATENDIKSWVNQ